MTSAIQRKNTMIFVAVIAVIFSLFTFGYNSYGEAFSSSNHRAMTHNYLIDGALFDSSGSHYCSASVLKSKSHNLITTASHCINSSNENNSYFIAGFNANQKNPIKWKVISHYTSDKWGKGNDDNYDYSVLKLAPQKINGKMENVQDYSNGGLIPSSEVKPGSKINVTGYNDGTDKPISCDTTLIISNGTPSFNCEGYSSGVSGSPFEYDNSLTDERFLVGIIGGYKQGGCTTSTSYSSPIDKKLIKTLKDKAKNNENSTKLPKAIKDDC